MSLAQLQSQVCPYLRPMYMCIVEVRRYIRGVEKAREAASVENIDVGKYRQPDIYQLLMVFRLVVKTALLYEREDRSRVEYRLRATREHLTQSLQISNILDIL